MKKKTKTVLFIGLVFILLICILYKQKEPLELKDYNAITQTIFAAGVPDDCEVEGYDVCAKDTRIDKDGYAESYASAKLALRGSFAPDYIDDDGRRVYVEKWELDYKCFGDELYYEVGSGYDFSDSCDEDGCPAEDYGKTGTLTIYAPQIIFPDVAIYCYDFDDDYASGGSEYAYSWIAVGWYFDARTDSYFVEDYPDADGDGVYDFDDECPYTPIDVIDTVDEDGCAMDSDADGVIDFYDECPDTPEGEDVDITGCLVDTDGDGVPDIEDECPSTIIEEIDYVDEFGCALDSDNDGVTDYFDQCNNTPEGEEVNSVGCPEGEEPEINETNETTTPPSGGGGGGGSTRPSTTTTTTTTTPTTTPTDVGTKPEPTPVNPLLVIGLIIAGIFLLVKFNVIKIKK